MSNEYPPDEEDYDGPSATGFPIPRSQGVRNQSRGRLAPNQKVQKTKGPMTKHSQRILAQQKRRTAVEMRKAGATYQQIADVVGYADASGAHRAVGKAFGQMIQEPVQELKVLQIERLNHMLVAIWGKVQTGDERSIHTALSIMDKIDRLEGTESAQRVEINQTTNSAVLIVDGSKDDYITALKKMSGAGIQPDGTNAGAPGVQVTQALPIASRYPPGMAPQEMVVVDEEQQTIEDIVDAIVISDDGEPQYVAKMSDCLGELGKVCLVEGCPVHHPAPSIATQKKFSWGMDPKAKPRPKDQR